MFNSIDIQLCELEPDEWAIAKQRTLNYHNKTSIYPKSADYTSPLLKKKEQRVADLVEQQ